MKICFAYFKIKFMSSIQYRASAIAGILTQFFFGFILVFVYLAFYESNNIEPPMEATQIVSYLWLQQAFFALTYSYHKDKEIVNMIKTGNVAYELCKPCNLYFKWFFRILGDKVSKVLLRFFPIIIMSIFLFKPYNLGLPFSIYSFIGFIITLIISSFLITGITTLLHILVFYTIESDGVLNMFKVIVSLFAGTIVPIPFLPKFLQIISNLLPFQYVGDIPYRIYSGNVSESMILPTILIQIIWITIIMVFSNLLVKKTLNKVVIQGG